MNLLSIILNFKNKKETNIKYKKILALTLSSLTLFSLSGPIGCNLNVKSTKALSDTQFENVKPIRSPSDILQFHKQVEKFVKKLRKNSNGSLSNIITIKHMKIIEERLHTVISGVQSTIRSNDNSRL